VTARLPRNSSTASAGADSGGALLKELLRQGESDTVEFKTSFGREAMETLAAFANAKGGTLAVGVNNASKVLGVSLNAETLQKWVNQVKMLTAPAIFPEAEVIDWRDKQVVIFWVPPHPVKPVSLKGRYYTRKHGANHLMNLEEIANEHLKTINLSWDFAPDPRHGIKDISLDKVNGFVERANTLREHPITDDPLTVLRKFELIRDQAVSFGCFLLFGQEPTLITTIEAGRFDSETIIRDHLTIRDDLFAEVDACMGFVRKHISKRFVITGKVQRDEVWEYPLEAVREIVLNMIVHRDYRASADSTIKIHSDRIEFFNPGALPNGLTLPEILAGRCVSNPRNKQIAGIFKEAGAIEKYGSGIKRVRQTMLAAGAGEPRFEVIGNFFKVTLFPLGGGVNEGVNKGVNEGVNKGVASLLAAIGNTPGQRAPFYAIGLDTSPKNVERWLKQLKNNGQIEFRGAPRTGGYFVRRGGK